MLESTAPKHYSLLPNFVEWFLANVEIHQSLGPLEVRFLGQVLLKRCKVALLFAE